MKKVFSIMSNLQTHYHFKLDFQNVDQHTGGKLLIHCTKHRKDIKLQGLELSCGESKHDIKEYESNMFYPIFKWCIQGRKRPGKCAFAETKLLCFRKPKRSIQKKENSHKNLNNIHDYHDETLSRKY